MPLRCPVGHPAGSGQTACPLCGRALVEVPAPVSSDVAKPETVDPPPLDSDGTLCASCASPVPLGSGSCVGCGASQHVVKPSPSEMGELFAGDGVLQSSSLQQRGTPRRPHLPRSNKGQVLLAAVVMAFAGGGVATAMSRSANSSSPSHSGTNQLACAQAADYRQQAKEAYAYYPGAVPPWLQQERARTSKLLHAAVLACEGK